MKFTERIRQLRENRKIPQRKMAAALDIDTATYSKIERGERKVKAEQVVVIAKLLEADKDELLTLWLADQVSTIVTDKQKIAQNALNIAKNHDRKK
jgi:transcriptional regulator with XRE-family HTH domain